MTQASVTVGLPTFGRNRVLVSTIRQLLEEDPPPDEIIVVDQTVEHDESTRAYLEWAGHEGRLQLIRQPRPSLTEARNRVLVEARGEIVLFVDDDVLLPTAYVFRHARHYVDPRVAAVSGPIFPAGITPSGLDWQTELPRTRAGRTPLAQALAGTVGRTQVVEGIPALYGGNHSVRRTTVIGVGGYDEGFQGPANFEEMDLAFRLHAAGGLIVYDPRAWLVHLKVPYGGCRIPGNSAWPEWQKTLGMWLFLWRHVSADIPLTVRYNLWRSLLRAGPLRRENVVRFWRQPLAWGHFVRASVEGRRRALRAVTSPFSEGSASP